jgi:hypothetical protein
MKKQEVYLNRKSLFSLTLLEFVCSFSTGLCSFLYGLSRRSSFVCLVVLPLDSLLCLTHSHFLSCLHSLKFLCHRKRRDESWVICSDSERVSFSFSLSFQPLITFPVVRHQLLRSSSVSLFLLNRNFIRQS